MLYLTVVTDEFGHLDASIQSEKLIVEELYKWNSIVDF